MFTIDEMLSKKNQKVAFEHFALKKDGCGIDGMHLSELEQYWEINQEHICEEIRNQEYEPDIVLIRECINRTGKRRNIASLTVLDRFITRLLAQKLNRYFLTLFMDNSFAYQTGKGTLEAVMKVKEYVEKGKRYVVEIDLKNYFDTIPLEKLIAKIERYISDKAVLYLIKQYLFCKISIEGKISSKTIGIIQGNAISPVLSNLYLQEFDQMLEERKYCWIRYADNIYIYADLYEESIPIYNEIVRILTEDMNLIINQDKSGIFNVYKRTILGYDILTHNDRVDVRKHIYKSTKQYSNWHDSKLEFVNGKFHILSDGIINRQDYSLLFENEQKRHYIPVEVVDQINIYGNVTLANNVLETFNNKGIQTSFYDKYGYLIGTFIPEKNKKNAKIILEQSKNYMDTAVRIDMARKMEIAGLHNMRANLRYYEKRHKGRFTEAIESIGEFAKQMKSITEINAMMLIEAKARQKYYSVFDQILENEEFKFVQRTKRPPKNEINACLSFGNTLLYNQFSSLIWKKGLDIRFGIVHATNRRTRSLNLDFADIFKPIIIDRVIFTMINKKMLTVSMDFEKTSMGGVYLSKEGKKVFLRMYEEKLNSKIIVKGERMTYRRLLENEVQSYKNYLLNGEKYNPYKYY